MVRCWLSTLEYLLSLLDTECFQVSFDPGFLCDPGFMILGIMDRSPLPQAGPTSSSLYSNSGYNLHFSAEKLSLAVRQDREAGGWEKQRTEAKLPARFEIQKPWIISILGCYGLIHGIPARFVKTLTPVP